MYKDPEHDKKKSTDAKQKMTQMLELSDKNGEVAVFHVVKISIVIINGKINSRKIKTVKKEVSKKF